MTGGMLAGELRVKAGVDFGHDLAFGGARILEVLKQLQATYPFNVTITSARDGVHSGPNDPHPLGNAFDIRTHDLTLAQEQRLLADLQVTLGSRFYAFLEHPDLIDVHIHVQVARGTTYTIADYLRSA